MKKIIPSLKNRKNSHLEHCLNDPIERYTKNSNGFSHFRFHHDALPEVDFQTIDLKTTIFGKQLAAPLMIGAMTGGTSQAKKINRRLALAAEACGIALSLGSQRAMIQNTRARSSYAVRQFAPSLAFLIGNIGAVQLNYGVRLKDIQKLIQDIECDAFNFHLNPLQEVIQPEGNRNFENLTLKIKEAIPALNVPVLVKEVGAGISRLTSLKLKNIPLSGIETAGCGGTSWAMIESLRAKKAGACLQEKAGIVFSDWGISTAESLIQCRKNLPHLKIIASGGIRNGIEAAKALALGADLVAFSLPLLKAAHRSTKGAIAVIHQIQYELQMVLFLTGTKSIQELRQRGPEILERATAF